MQPFLNKLLFYNTFKRYNKKYIDLNYEIVYLLVSIYKLINICFINNIYIATFLYNFVKTCELLLFNYNS